MGFAAATDVPWTIVPTWANGLQETLSWSTDVMQSSGTAVTQHRALRTSPRRSFVCPTLADGQARRAAEMLLAGRSGLWQFPIWPDVQWLDAPLASGATAVPCVTAGYDFVAGGKALLYSGVDTWEIVSIDSIEADHLVLASATTAAYGAGDRLYPLRLARVRNGAEETLLNERAGQRSLTFDIAEACDWPTLASPTMYLGHPVLDVRPSETTAPTASVSRLEQTVDYGTALPVTHDLPGVALRVQQSHWQLYGRAEHTWFRSLIYTLDGRRAPMWVPSFASDLQPIAAVAGGTKTMLIDWAGYAQFGLDRPNRKDVRIELIDGTVLYRRITATSVGAGTETLNLDASLSSASIAPEYVRQISFMALCTLASDDVELDHATDQDGLATVTTGWQAVVPDV